VAALVRRRFTLTDVPIVLLALWVLVFPRPYVVCVALLSLLPIAALPVLTFVQRQPGEPPRWLASLAGLAGAAGVLLALRAAMDFALLDWRPPLLTGMLLGAALTAAAAPVLLALAQPQLMITLAAAAAVAWGWGLAAEANGLFDRAPSKTHAVRVLNKHVSRGGRSTTYYLDIAPSGIAGLGDSLSVDFSLYRGMPVGGVVCIDKHSGALHWRWFRARACPTASAP
jgi:hypothetical protein